MDFIESLTYSRDGHMTAFGAVPTPAVMYASIEAAMTALDAVGGTRTARISLDGDGDRKPIRVNLSMALAKPAANAVVNEDTYLVKTATLDGKIGVVLEKACSIAWSEGADKIDDALGGDGKLHWPKAAVVADTGLLTSRGCSAPLSSEQSPCFVTIFDGGNASAILRVMSAGTADGAEEYRPIHERWR